MDVIVCRCFGHEPGKLFKKKFGHIFQVVQQFSLFLYNHSGLSERILF